MVTTFTVTSEEEGRQLPFDIVQRKIFIPPVNPLTPLEKEFAFEKVPFPETTVHTPFPIAGLFPDKVVEAEQIV